jgi:hypothetical protein
MERATPATATNWRAIARRDIGALGRRHQAPGSGVVGDLIIKKSATAMNKQQLCAGFTTIDFGIGYRLNATKFVWTGTVWECARSIRSWETHGTPDVNSNVRLRF